MSDTLCCRVCGAELKLGDGWMPTYADPDNNAVADPAEPFCPKCDKDKRT